MGRFRHRMATAPLGVHFVVMAVSFCGITWGLAAWVDDGPQEPWWEHAVAGVLYGVLVTAFLAYRRRKDGGAERQWSVGTAIRRGQLPADADADEWRPVLERKKADVRRYRTLNGVVFGLFTLLAVGLALTEGPQWWAFAAFFVGFAVFGVITCERAVDKIERMLLSFGPSQDAPV